MIRTKILLAAIFTFCFLFPQKTYSQQRIEEKINSYESYIEIEKDGLIKVKESISVYANGTQIKRGIYKDFSTVYADELGLRHKVEFKIQRVLKNGSPEPYHIEILGNILRIYIGKEDLFIPTGNYFYIIEYETKGQIGFFDDQDELYFNITGNGWNFPISSASAKIKLPQGIKEQDVKIEAFTGKSGSKEKNYLGKVYTSDDNTYTEFTTIKELKNYEGLTTVVGWPKGFVTQPTQSEEVGNTISSNISIAIGAILFFVLAIYYLVVWYLKGNDPDTPIIITEYEPPQNISPAGVRYLSKMRYDDGCISANIIDMAIKGFINIREIEKKFSIQKIRDTYDGLSEDEILLSEIFFDEGKNEFLFKSTNSDKIIDASRKLNKKLKKLYSGTYFRNNFIYTIPPLVLILIYLFIIFIESPGNFMGLIVPIWSLLFFIAIFQFMSFVVDSVVSNIRNEKYKEKIKMLFKYMLSGGLLFYLFYFFVFILLLLSFSRSNGSFFLPIFFMYAFIFMHFFFAKYVIIRTKIGHEAHIKILGLKKYLLIAEERRYESELHSEMPINLSVYEKYLPYAIALDVETNWTKRFKEDLSRYSQSSSQGTDNDVEYMRKLRWYSSSGNFGSLFSAAYIGQAITQSISKSQMTSRSSSGFSSRGSGGGFSGGGHGSRGGGGW